jgi:hypothetical protein
LGRFVSADTIVPDPANPQSLNRYSYVYDNPLKYVDPTGHFTEDDLKYFGVESWDEFRELYGDELYELMNSELTCSPFGHFEAKVANYLESRYPIRHSS